MTRPADKFGLIRTLLRFYFLILFPIYSLASIPILSTEELAWIKQHPPIRVGVTRSWAPFNFTDSRDNFTGIARDYFDLIEQSTGLKFEYTPESEKRNIEKIKRKEIDVLPTLYDSSERRKFLNFTSSYFELLDYFFFRDDLSIKNFSDLNNLRLAIPEGYATIEIIKTRFPNIELVMTDSFSESITKVLDGDADLIYDTYGVMIYSLRSMGVNNIVPFKSIPNLASGETHIGVRRDWPVLASIMDKGLNAITIEQQRAIKEKWLGEFAETHAVQLTTKEQAWLDRHPTIRFAGDPNWLPFEAFNEEGSYIGIVAEHLKLIEKKLSIRLQIIPTENWKQTLELINDGKVDVFSETSDSLLSQKFRFTQAYSSSPIVIIMGHKESYVDGLSQIQNLNIAMIEEYGYVNTIKNAYPKISFSSVTSIQSGLTAVSTGKADALVATLAQASYHISALGISNVRIVGETEFRTQLAFGVRPDYAPLVAMFNRAIQDIHQSEKQQILDQWGQYKFTSRVDYVFIGKVAVGFLIIISAVLFWNQRLARENRLRREAEAQTQALIDHIPVQVMVTDHLGNILKANPKVLIDFEVTEEELYSTNFIEMFAETPSHSIGFMQELVSRGKLSQQIMEIRNPKNQLHSMMVSAIPFHYKNKNCFLVLGVDLSERLEMEEELHRQKERAEIASHAKSEFLANMSHEIRTPMNAILGFAELLNDQLTDQKLQTYVQTIRSASNNLLLLINDILDLSKIEAGKMEISISAVNVHSLFDELEKIFKLEFYRKGIEFNLEVDSTLPEYLMLDLPRLRQILVNLLGNAVKFTDSGYVRLRVSSEYVRECKNKINLKIDIEDTGIGIDSHQLESIFDSFQQSEGQDNSRYGGTGLGLTISKRLATLMGGCLSVISELGKGTIFTFNLKGVSLAVDAAIQTVPVEETMTQVDFHEATVLVVDDVADNRQLIIENFSNSKLVILEACNGQEAIERVKKEGVDLILMDLRMPVMNGYQAAEIIKAQFDIPIIAVTASVMKDDLDRLKSEHFNGYLRKPLEKKELQKLLTKYLPHEKVELNVSIEITTTLSEEEKKIIPELLQTLSNIQPLWLQVQKSNDIQEIRLLAEKLQSINQQFHFEKLQEITESLLKKTDSFDINGIAVELKNYGKLVEYLLSYR